MSAPRPPAEGSLRAAVRRRGSFVQTAKAVAWSFFGVRRAKDQEQDLSTINPLHVIIAGVAGAVIFVVLLVVLVSTIVGSGVAA